MNNKSPLISARNRPKVSLPLKSNYDFYMPSTEIGLRYIANRELSDRPTDIIDKYIN